MCSRPEFDLFGKKIVIDGQEFILLRISKISVDILAVVTHVGYKTPLSLPVVGKQSGIFDVLGGVHETG